MERLCYCGCTEEAHDHEGCVSCPECHEFRKDPDATVERADQNGEIDYYDGLEDDDPWEGNS